MYQGIGVDLQHVLVVQPIECKFYIDLIAPRERVVTSVDMIIIDDILWKKTRLNNP